MAPGVFCVWSRADPEGDTAGSNSDSDAGNEAELFTDGIAKLKGVSRGVRFARGDTQSVEAPYTHEVPYVSMYELPDTSYTEDDDFKEAVAQCAFKETDSFKPRLYEEIERQEAEDFEGDPVIGGFVTIVTAEHPPAAIDELFWKFHREEFVGAFMQAPEFIRCQVFRMVGDLDPEAMKTAPSGPVLIMYHWDCVEVPWTEIIAAAQTEGYIKFLESGIKWQGVNFHPIRFSEEQPPRRFSMYGQDSTYGGEEELEIGVEDGASEAEQVDVDEKRKSSNAIEPETAGGKVELSTNDAASRDYAAGNKDAPTSNGAAREMLSGADDAPTKQRKERADTVVTGGDVITSKMNGLSFAETTKPTNSEVNGNNTAAGAEADPPVFMSVRDRIRAWEKSGTSS